MRMILNRAFGSLSFKIIGLMGVMGLTTAAAVTLGLQTFLKTSSHVSDLITQDVQVLANSNIAMSELSHLSENVAKVLAAATDTELQTADALITENFIQLRTDLRTVLTPDLSAQLARIQTSAAEMVAARGQEFVLQDSISAKLTAIDQTANDLEVAVDAGSDAAYADLLVGGQATADAVAKTLEGLIAQDVERIQAALTTRIEVNALIGVVLGLSAKPDEARIAILTDLARASVNRLATVRTTISDQPDSAEQARALDDILTRMAAIVDAPQTANFLGKALIADMQRIDAALLVWQDDLRFTLELSAIEAGEQNKAAIETLLEKHVEPLRQLALLDATARSVSAAATAVALTRNPIDAERATAALSANISELQGLIPGVPADLREKAESFLQMGDAQTGIAAEQLALLSARARAEAVSGEVVDAVGTLAATMRGLAKSTLTSVADGGRDLMAQAEASINALWLLAALTGALIAGAPVVAWVFVIAPIRRATRATTGLAAGNLAAADGLRSGAGEIGDLGKALLVFRDTLRAKITLEAEEQRAAEARRAQSAAEARAVQERERLEAVRLAEAERHERERVAAAEAERQRLRQIADAERQALMDLQDQIVATLAQALRRLSEGDLTVEIVDAFAGGHDSLRVDFNVATRALRDLVQDIRRMAENIDGETGGIADAAEELSRRTESTAATLEESAAALSELTSLVKSTAARSREARHAVENATEKADQGRAAVQSAKGAIDAIARSSSQISSIVEMIEGIAFQTNLLALNAGVEAARAGEAGRGFAVVASEVRALSQRTTEAARDISALIAQSAQEVQRGVHVVGDVDLSLSEIGEAVERLTQTIRAISAASEEQASGLTEIDSAVSQLDQNTQSNAAISEEVTASGQTLRQQVSALRDQLMLFRVEAGRQARSAGQWQELRTA